MPVITLHSSMKFPLFLNMADKNFMFFFSYCSAMSFEADLAVIELAQRITFDDYKQPVALGMVSNTKSLVTIFGHKILNKKNFHVAEV